MKIGGAVFVLVIACSRPCSAVSGSASPSENKGTAPTRKEELLRKIEALTKLKTLDQRSISKALGTALTFEDVSQDELSKDFAAHGRPGAAFGLVDLRGEPGEFLAVHVSSSLAITGDDIGSRFGRETGTHHPDHHSPPDSPWYYVYSRPKEQLKFGMKPGKPAVLVEVILDRTESE